MRTYRVERSKIRLGVESVRYAIRIDVPPINVTCLGLVEGGHI